MKKQTACDFEQPVIKSLKNGLLDAELTKHLETCQSCQETARIVSFFQKDLLTNPAPKNLLSAGLIWWKSKLQEKRNINRQIAQPLFITQIAAGVVVLAAIIGISIFQPQYFAPIAQILSGSFELIGHMLASLFIMIAILGAVSVITLFSIRRLTANE